jgi:hypothetical protein
MVFGLLIGFIDHLQVVFKINFNTVPDFTLQITPRQSPQSISSCLQYLSPNNGFITQELASSHSDEISSSLHLTYSLPTEIWLRTH